MKSYHVTLIEHCYSKQVRVLSHLHEAIQALCTRALIGIVASVRFPGSEAVQVSNSIYRCLACDTCHLS